eukprot:scaffold178798_cov36-Tisochrysis_lutea.AAC.4
MLDSTPAEGEAGTALRQHPACPCTLPLSRTTGCLSTSCCHSWVSAALRESMCTPVGEYKHKASLAADSERGQRQKEPTQRVRMGTAPRTVVGSRQGATIALRLAMTT